MQRARSGRVPNLKLLCPQEASPTWHINVDHQPGRSPELQCPEFLLEFPYKVYDWLDDWPSPETKSPVPFLLPGGADTMTQSPNHLIKGPFFREQPAPMLGILKLRYSPRSPPWIRKMLLSLRKFQGFRGSLLGNRGKDQSNSLLFNTLF